MSLSFIPGLGRAHFALSTAAHPANPNSSRRPSHVLARTSITHAHASNRARAPPSVQSADPRSVSLDSDRGSIGSTDEGIRINKCFKSFASRRESDKFIESGRVLINSETARSGDRVHPGDKVYLDGREIAWERLTVDVGTDDFVYIKHWKREGVLCTTDPEVPNNIINEISLPPPTNDASSPASADRIFPIGRLDEPSTGVILLTSDGRLPNYVLGANASSVKEYVVLSDMYVSDEHLQELRDGVVITTIAQRDRNVRKPRTAKTLPCEVERLDGFELLFRLKEGRNRQIRKMLGVLGYTTRDIHRVSFMGITLDGLSHPGDSKYLDEDEMKLVKAKLQSGQQNTPPS